MAMQRTDTVESEKSTKGKTANVKNIETMNLMKNNDDSKHDDDDSHKNNAKD
jgi:hypothetical protein